MNGEIKKNSFSISNISCGDCAMKIEQELRNIEGFSYASLNFAAGKLKVETKGISDEEIIKTVRRVSENIEKGIIVEKPGKEGFLKPEDTEKYVFGNKILSGANIGNIRIAAGFVLGLAAYFTGRIISVEYISLALYLAAYIVSGGSIVRAALHDISRGRLFDEKFLMSVATAGAFIIGEYPEAVAVMLFYRIGEAFQSSAVDKSRRKIKSLMKIKPEYANLVQKNGIKKVSPESVKKGDYIVVKPGEKVPLDGIITKGSSLIDKSSITGESMPERAGEEDTVLAGCVNTTGMITLRVINGYSESAIARIMDLIENASAGKAKTENFISRFAKIYTPVVVGAAVMISVLPPLVITDANFSEWVYRGLLFLVISCPCALVISIPLGFFGGIAGASSHGILVKGGNYLEALSNSDTIVFDKTGTLTKGAFRVTDIYAENSFSEKDILEAAFIAESNSNHPIAKSIVSEYKGITEKLPEIAAIQTQEFPGSGIRAVLKEREILAGNIDFMKSRNISVPHYSGNSGANAVHIADNGIYMGYMEIEDEIKPGTKEVINELKKSGIENIAMFTGDSAENAEKTGHKTGIDIIYSSLLPGDKLEIYNKIKRKYKSGKSKIFAGDGINDAPVLAGADIGISMGYSGSDAAIESSDVVIMDDDLKKIVKAVKISAKTKNIVRQNIVMALGVKAIVLVLGSLGMASIWGAVFADVGVALLAVLNSVRAMKIK